MIMTSPMRLTTIPTMTLVRQTARPTKVPSTAVDKLVQIMGEVKVLLFLRARIWRRTSRMIPTVSE